MPDPCAIPGCINPRAKRHSRSGNAYFLAYCEAHLGARMKEGRDKARGLRVAEGTARLRGDGTVVIYQSGRWRPAKNDARQKSPDENLDPLPAEPVEVVLGKISALSERPARMNLSWLGKPK